MPAVLLECGVIVNRSEEASLQTPEIQHRIAEAAAEAIMQFLHDRRIGVQAVDGSTR
jgi:N-acetylmuramoyl-L-alanine amidase